MKKLPILSLYSGYIISFPKTIFYFLSVKILFAKKLMENGLAAIFKMTCKRLQCFFFCLFLTKMLLFIETITKSLYTIFFLIWLKFTVPKKPNMRICQQKPGRLTRYVFIGILVSHEKRPFHYLNMLSTSFTGREQRVKEKRRVCSRRKGWHYCPFQNVMM